MQKSPFFDKRLLSFFLTTISLLIFVSAINAQTSSIDLSFNPVIAKSATTPNDFEIQPDGKIVFFGFNDVRIFNGVPKNQIARLNIDGSLDNSFNCPSCDFNISSVRAQTDGKLIITGILRGNGFNSPRIRRLNADGSLDSSFTSPFSDGNPMYSLTPSVTTIQPDGKILVVLATFTSSPGIYQEYLYRLNPDGSYDNSFTTIAFSGGRTVYQTVSQVKLQADGKILVGGVSRGAGSGTAFIYRFNIDGTRDTSFELPVFSDNSPFGGFTIVLDFEVFNDGSLLIVGRFKTVNSVSRLNIVKLLSAGNVDLNYTPSNIFDTTEFPTRVKVFPNGKILFSTTSTQNRFLRFNADGSLDTTFNAPTNFAEIGKWVVDAQDRILASVGIIENGTTVYKTIRLNSNGSLDTTFDIPAATLGTTLVLAVQTDGKTIVAGDFTRINNVSRRNFARVNSDGSLDTTFDVGSSLNIVPAEIVFQADGKILVGGDSSSQLKLVRLNIDGSLDGSFAPIVANPTGSNAVNSIAVRTDGKILVGGSFTTVNGQSRTALALLNADGNLDSTFNPTLGNNGAGVNDIKIQSDGKILIGGTFTGVNGFSRNNLVRLNADGSLDTTFNAGTINAIKQLEIQNDGKLVVSTSTLIRLNNNGTVDSTFQSPNFTYQENNLFLNFLLQTDGSLIVGGNFNAVNGVSRSYFTRLKSDGTVDLLFIPTGADNLVNTIVRANDGKILVGGTFLNIGGTFRPKIARINAAPTVRSTPFDFDGDGRADVSVFRPSNGYWFTSTNPAVNYGAYLFGISTDLLVPADYDGDGKTDIAVVRDGTWYIQRSTLGFTGIKFGFGSDIPVPADYDGDGKADIAVFRPSNGIWYLNRSSLGYTYTGLGSATDIPVPADYDGDGKTEPAVFRPSNGYWYNSTNPATNYGGVAFGQAEDKPVPADYDGDGKIDRAVFRPSNGTWYILQSSAGFTGVAFGLGSDLPTAADYDGDGKADVAVFRNGNWYLNRSQAGFTAILFGLGDDKPIPNSFIK